MVQDLVLNKWKVVCFHTPETIDKIVMNFRKRSMSLNSFNYKKLDDNKAICEIEFDDTLESATKIYNNMLRIYDIEEVIRLN